MARSRKEFREEKNKKSRKPRKWLWFILLLLLIAATFYGLNLFRNVRSTTDE